ncbi:hypothetical protein [Neotamlana laminarinivorans]|uniref:MotA/TolQ/ExbB proton channel family protein n=1 Tax=Neotamlana laminarinivorans TaxID=2883124 RepID=A0A9X1L2X8_9FLAO|nr:hypothetical protein [Tamlana laminarinivorans]MCB4800250.1 hypothetical protein [Tamlana laminarinivorans]
MVETINNNLDNISYVVAFLILICPYILKSWFGKSHIAGLTITLGIFGTFFGVFIGLLGFDTNQITESIPVLLSGLKTAFVTSLAGLMANLILRTSPIIYGFKAESVGRKSDNIGEQIIESLNKLASSISGDGESTMVTQLQKIRTTNSDGLEKLNLSFIDFAEKMVADNTQSLIDALTEVMKDFNNKINEQFGENFRKLNEAVGAMVVWQGNYKDHVEILTERFNNISKNIEGIDKTLSQTAKNHTIIYETNTSLNKLIKDFSLEVSSFAEIGAKAKDSFPLIENNMNNLIETSTNYVNQNIKNLKTQYEEFTTTQNRVLDDYGKKMDDFSRINTDNFNNFSSKQIELANSYEDSLKKMINDNAERVQQLDAELGQELNRALESLGSQLTSLSQHFVNDYRPLTESLRKVVELSKSI